MRTTKMRRDVLKRWLANEDYEPSQDDVAELLLDLDEQLENVAAIALAAGLGADATAEEVAARVGELRGALVEMHLASLDIEGLSPTESSTRWSRMIDADDAIDNLARRLAEEAGRG